MALAPSHESSYANHSRNAGFGAVRIVGTGADGYREASGHDPGSVEVPLVCDGWFDVSGFLDEKYGFLPLIIPITEPAVGYGATGALAFLDQPLEGLEPRTVRGASWSATYATGSTTSWRLRPASRISR
jgi:hypothetical protein